MVVIQTKEASRTLETGSVPNTGISGAPGRALQQIGANVEAFEQRFKENQNKLEAFKAETSIVDLQGEMTGVLRDGQNNLQPGAEGFHDNIVGEFDVRSNQILDGIKDPNLKQKVQLSIQRLRNGVSDKAASVQFTERSRFFNDEIDRSGSLIMNNIDGSEGALTDSIAKFDEIVESSGLTPIEKQAKKRAFQDLAVAKAIQNIARNDPDRAKKFIQIIRNRQAQGTRRPGVPAKGAGNIQREIIAAANANGVSPQVLLGIAKIESGFRPSAKNPKSSAAGLFQFITSTGRQFGLPENAAKASSADQSKAGAVFTAKNIAGLKASLGREPTAGETYLAHFLGLQGARNIVNVSRETTLKKALGPSANAILKANPALKRIKTAGGLIQWADNAMSKAMLESGKFLDNTQQTFESAGTRAAPLEPDEVGGFTQDLTGLNAPVAKTDEQFIEELSPGEKEIFDALSADDVVISPDNVNRLDRFIDKRQDEIIQAEETQEEDAGDDVFKEGLSRAAQGELTLEFVEENRGVLSTEQFKQLLNATTGNQTKKSDPDIFSDLLNRADTEPKQVQEEALTAFERGLLTQQDLSKLFNIARQFEDDVPRWRQSVKDFVKFSLKPTEGFDISGRQARRQQNALLDLERFFLENPDVGFEEARKRAGEIVDGTKTTGIADTGDVLEVPMFIDGPGDTITSDQLQTARARINQAMESGEISQQAAIRQSKLLMQWISVVGDK